MNCAYQLCLPFSTKKRMCDVCDEITDVLKYHKLNQIPSTVIDDDMEILVRFEWILSGFMADPTHNQQLSSGGVSQPGASAASQRGGGGRSRG